MAGFSFLGRTGKIRINGKVRRFVSIVSIFSGNSWLNYHRRFVTFKISCQCVVYCLLVPSVTPTYQRKMYVVSLRPKFEGRNNCLLTSGIFLLQLVNDSDGIGRCGWYFEKVVYKPHFSFSSSAFNQNYYLISTWSIFIYSHSEIVFLASFFLHNEMIEILSPGV
jgi:hypothetical protein